VTDADGVVEFATIYPGWYPGRAVHAHLKVILDNRTAVTSQLFFDEEFSDAVFARPPYATGATATPGSRATWSTPRPTPRARRSC